MAAINKRGPYQWRAQIRRHGFPPVSKTFTTKSEAEAWTRMNESEMSRGVWVSRAEAETTTLREALDRYEREITPGKKSAVGEKSFLRMWRGTAISDHPLASIRSSDVAKLRDKWLKEYQPATVLRRLAVLSHVFTIARKEWEMESLSNPIELIRKPQPNNARTRRVAVDVPPPGAIADSTDKLSSRNASDGELERVIAATSSDLLPAIVGLAVETAMRRGEIVGLLWENIDLERRVAHLPETKNGNSRDVPLSSRAVKILSALQRAPEEFREGGVEEDVHSSPDFDQVFAIRSDAVTRAFERAVDRARKTYLVQCKNGRLRPDARYLTDLRFHDLRHEATSRLAEIFPLHELTKITGHKDPRMLMRYYHPRAEDLAKRLP